MSFCAGKKRWVLLLKMKRNELATGSHDEVRHPTTTNASFSGAHPGFYRGIVIVRDDPDKQGRIKVACPQIYGDIPVDELPWVYPSTNSWDTSNQGQEGLNNGATNTKKIGAGGNVNVPPLGSTVMLGFEGHDHRYPFYIGGTFGKPGLVDCVPNFSFAKNGNSPDNYSFTTPGGSCVQMDNRPGTEKIIAIDPKGNYVSISQAGLVEVKSKATVSIKAATLVTLNCDTKIETKGKQVLVYATGDLVVEGANSVSVNSNSVINLQASSIKLNCNSSSTGKTKPIQTAPVMDGS